VAPDDGPVRACLVAMLRHDLDLAATPLGRAIVHVALCAASDSGGAPRIRMALRRRQDHYRIHLGRLGGADANGSLETASAFLGAVVWGSGLASVLPQDGDVERIVDAATAILAADGHRRVRG
jgi:hypothetical protein